MDNCGVVRDLLPLYVDGACSEASRALVERHVAACPSCAKMLSQLQNSACEESLRREAGTVLASRRWGNRAFAMSCALAAFLCVPACVLAALEPEMMAGTDRPWLFCLFLLPPSLLVVMSAAMLPLRCRRYTVRWTLLGYTASLLLLLMACALYSGRMLFRVAAVALYVLSACLIVPWAVRELPLPGKFGKKKALAVAARVLGIRLHAEKHHGPIGLPLVRQHAAEPGRLPQTYGKHPLRIRIQGARMADLLHFQNPSELRHHIVRSEPPLFIYIQHSLVHERSPHAP